MAKTVQMVRNIHDGHADPRRVLVDWLIKQGLTSH